MDAANRHLPVGVRRRGDERLILAVVDHQLEPQTLGVREHQAIRHPFAGHADTCQATLPEVERAVIGDAKRQPVDHPRARPAAHHARTGLTPSLTAGP